MVCACSTNKEAPIAYDFFSWTDSYVAGLLGVENSKIDK